MRYPCAKSVRCDDFSCSRPGLLSIFMKNEEAILNGQFETALLDVSQYKAQIKDIIDLSVKNVYRSKEVINKEIAGYEILNQLLNAYGKFAFNYYEGRFIFI